MTFEELRHEYEELRIGEDIFARIQQLVGQVARSYPPGVYSELSAAGGDWSDEALEALAQAFITESLLAEGQLDYTMAQAASLADFDRLTRFQLRHHLRDTRRRTVVDNLLDRARDRIKEAPYELIDKDHWQLAGRAIEDREPHRDELTTALLQASLIPREPSNALERAPRVYAPNDLGALLKAVAASFGCRVSLDHLRWIFLQLLTELAPSELLPIREDMVEEQDSLEYAAWAETNLRAERHAGGPLVAAPQPSPEEAALVSEAVQNLRSALSAEEAEILRLKLAGLADAKVAAAVSLSRATVVARKKAIFTRVGEHFSALDERWHAHALDELVRTLGDA